MNRRFGPLVSGVVLVASLTALDGLEAQGNGKSQGKRNGAIVRIHHEKDKSQGKPAWATDAMNRGRKHLRAVKEEAGIENPDTELTLESVLEDDMGQTHIRMNQVHAGIPVFGSQIVVELDDASGDKAFGKGDASARQINVIPGITGEEATQTAQNLLGYTGTFASPPTAQLVILPASEERRSATLTWLVELAIEDGTEATAHHRYFLDAHNGRVVLHYDAMNHASGTSYYSGTVPIETTYALLSDGKYMYRLWDRTRAMYTMDMLGGTTSGGVLSNATNVWGNTHPYRETAGVDAHFGVTKAWDYFRAKQGWTGINGTGEGVINQVHYGTGTPAMNNASQLNGVLRFGDGDGYTYKPWVGVDIVAHEYTHAVIWRTANLIYYGQSGALNESFADIFGTAVEFYTGIRPDYLIGEDFGIQKPLRSMENPRLYGQPDHASQYVNTTDDQGGVHTNSGIPNKVFYLLAQGGTHPVSGVRVSAIGRPAAEWIFFRTLRKLPSNATFSQARVATLSSAADGYGLYSGAWYAAKAAWDAVGVY
jgi:thermolysin